jgi:succinate dehydrogenase / fumarate reductase cytochrome b subunit
MNSISSCCPIFERLWKSTIGRKYLVAVTGVLLTLFLAGHLVGNLLVYVGPEAFDEYAEFLHHMLHGAGIWIFRIVMLAALAIHVAATISLTRQNRAARRQYECSNTIQATKSSLVMIWSGLTILAFVVFHLLHFTVRVDSDLAAIAARSPHAMVIAGFRNWLVVLFYIIAMTLLCSHLSHGVQAMFQTLGLRSSKTARVLDMLSLGYAVVIWIGFISIPIAIKIFNFGS